MLRRVEDQKRYIFQPGYQWNTIEWLAPNPSKGHSQKKHPLEKQLVKRDGTITALNGWPLRVA